MMLRLLIFLFLHISLVATNWYHGPFAPWEELDKIGIVELDALREPGSFWGVDEKMDDEDCRIAYYPIEGGHLRLHSFYRRSEDWDIYVSIGHKDKGFCEPLRFTECSAIGPLEVYEGFLNDDDIKDIVIVKYTGGNGSGGRDSYVGFLLSSPKKGGYNFQVTFTILPEENDFLIINDTKCFIQCDLKYYEECTDGKPHNFFVYRLLSFEGDTLKVDDSISEDFPKIIWWSFSPRHEETDLLTAEGKQTLISRDPPMLDLRGYLR